MNQNKFFFALVFACFGVTAEIVFTSISDQLVIPLMRGQQPDMRLRGESYLWMIIIYGLIPFILPPLYRKIAGLHILLRSIIYASAILCAEFISGALLDLLTGDCPWRYTTGLHVMGYIRIDYFPFWMLFGFLAERLWLILEKRKK